ncbi:MAG: VCBS repeat-containing protein [Bacteroidota bacterium]
MKKLLSSIAFISTLIMLIGCASRNASTPPPQAELSFESIKIADSLKLFWAHIPADLDGDGITDIVFVNNNGYGGAVEWLKGQMEAGLWQRDMIALHAPDGSPFAQGDIEVADIDFDGDLDILAIAHQGEWNGGSAPSKLYWLENPSWEIHFIGDCPNFVKDVSVGDLDQDQQMDVVALTFENSTLSIFRQNSAKDWTRVQYYDGYKNLHEGMDIGDLNGDGLIDIVANAHAFYNPGGDLTTSWAEQTINARWNSQEGDWSRNGTKIHLQDINRDKKAEVFVSHSERAGYPLAYYRQDAQGDWQEHIIADSIPACHTLQVADFDQDGDYDVLAGVNISRAKALNQTSFPVNIFLAKEEGWSVMELMNDGIYNGRVADLEGDGDMDIFRYQTHDATALHLLRNQLIVPAAD